MTTTINILPAFNGDCILIDTYDSENNQYTILIDGGTRKTFDELKKKLKDYKKIDLVILTHIDGDHINGLLRFFKSGFAKKIVFDKIIINAANLIPFSVEEEMGYAAAYRFEEEIVKNYKSIKIINDITNQNNKALGLPIGIDITFLSPNQVDLDTLKANWEPICLKEENGDCEMSSTIKYCDDYDKPLHILSAQNDIIQSKADIINASSLAFILKTNNFNGLFLGDAHHKVVSESICEYTQKLGLSLPLKFDLIKLSHHGSIKNTSNQLLNLIQSENFVISTNGGTTGKHPSRTTIAKIVCSPNKTPKIINLCTNYPLDKLQNKTGILLNPNDETTYNFNFLNKNLFSFHG